MFDGAAATYDTDFTHTDLGQWLRGQVWARLGHAFQAGDTVLEMGCGTGEDAVWLAQQGVQVVATDASPAMLAQTQAKATAAGVSDRITTQLLDFHNLPDTPLGQFAGVYSNFGAVNCTNDWAGLAEFLRKNVQVGGYVGLGIMAPFCLWETLWHALHLDFKTATRRWNGQSQAVLADGANFVVYYPQPRQVRQALSPHFSQIELHGLGVALPPSDAFAVIEKRPRLAQTLIQWEKRLSAHAPFKFWADHYWLAFRRNA